MIDEIRNMALAGFDVLAEGVSYTPTGQSAKTVSAIIQLGDTDFIEDEHHEENNTITGQIRLKLSEVPEPKNGKDTFTYNGITFVICNPIEKSYRNGTVKCECRNLISQEYRGRV